MDGYEEPEGGYGYGQQKGGGIVGGLTEAFVMWR
jgi:hypothetical protein